jgi:hypothetical protein
MYIRNLVVHLLSVVALGAGISAHAAIIFDNLARQDFTSNRAAGDSPLASITVSAATQINQNRRVCGLE